MPHTTRFTHQRLDAYHAALALARGVERLALPRGYAGLRDQLRRAAASVVLQVAEGANRAHPRDKAARFTAARGEAGECDAALHLVEVLELAPREPIRALRALADRVAAMLTGLVRRQERRAQRPGTVAGLSSGSKSTFSA